MRSESTDLDSLATELAQHVTHWQLEVGHGVPAIILAIQAEIIQRVAARLARVLRDAPANTRIRVDPTAAPHMVDVYLNDLEVPDTMPDDWH